MTLIELVIALVVLSIAGAALLNVYAYLAQRNADPLLSYQATAIAEAYLEEILGKSFTDPSDDPATGSACPTANAAGRASYDNVCDYRSLPDTVVRDQTGTALSGLEGYAVTVAVTSGTSWQGIAGADVVRVDVVVTDPSGRQVQLAGYRTRY